MSRRMERFVERVVAGGVVTGVVLFGVATLMLVDFLDHSGHPLFAIGAFACLAPVFVALVSMLVDAAL